MNVNQPVNNTLPLQPNKEVSVEKSFKIDEEDAAKPKLTETRKVTPLFTSFMMVTDGQHYKWHDVLMKTHVTVKMTPLKMFLSLTACVRLSLLSVTFALHTG